MSATRSTPFKTTVAMSRAILVATVIDLGGLGNDESKW